MKVAFRDAVCRFSAILKCPLREKTVYDTRRFILIAVEVLGSLEQPVP